MLSRVARQKNAFIHFRKARALRVSVPSPTTRLHSSPTHRSPLMTSSIQSLLDRTRKPCSQSERHLATAADHAPIDAQSMESYGQFMQAPFEGYDTSSLVILDSTPLSQSKHLRRRQGIGGDETEMMANLDVSLKLGQFERAGVLITRLGQYYPPASQEFLSMHNKYMGDMVTYMILHRDQSMVLPLQKWFEVDVPASGLKPDAYSYAIMLRMAMRMLHGAKRERTVRRYWGYVLNNSVEEEVLGMEVLDDSDVGELSKICSSDMLNLMSKYMDFTESVEVTPPTSHTTAEETPMVLAADQKGLGLSTLKQSLSLFEGKDVPFPLDFKGTKEEAMALYSELRQKRLETDSLNSAIERWRTDHDKRQKAGLNVASEEKKLAPVMSQWHTDLVARIKEEIELHHHDLTSPVLTVRQNDRCDYGIFLKALDPERIAAITVLTILSIFSRQGMSKGIKMTTVATALGKEVQDEYFADAVLKKTKASDKASDQNRLRAVKETLANRKDKQGRLRWKNLVENMAHDDTSILWGSRVHARVGGVLISMLLETGKVPVRSTDSVTGKKVMKMQPAFQHAYQISYGRRSGLLHMHATLVEMVGREPLPEVVTRHLPMISKPKPWTGVRTGGYHIYENSLVRTTPGELLQPAYLKAVLKDDGLKEIRSGLDVLGSTGWKINQAVFDVMLEAWNSGQPVGKLAPLEPALETLEPLDENAGLPEQLAWNRKMREIENIRSGFHSMRCFQNFQMEVARSFLKEVFYLPHNMDFRGRAYPLPPYLNQMGADNARGLLLFDVGKPLGAAGLRWLKIQVANLFGFDKASMSEREQFTMDNLEAVLDSANKGLHGQRWFLKAEDPWQLLAACFELRNALLLSDPTQYVSSLPIHQDGSCNGLQHYAALGGDRIGAQQVNLEPSDRPSDVYTGVCEFVKEAISRDAADGHELALLLDQRVTRKIVKQTVMTNVYGVTFLGATRQVKRQLVDYFPELTAHQRNHCCVYIARQIFGALGSMFNGAHEIQYWLGDCAHRITQSITPEQVDELTQKALDPNESSSAAALDPESSFRSTVIWTTPLGLPVVQPYRVRRTRRVRTSLQDLSIVDPSAEDVVQRRKQLQAFPPNFIHSLDATHMILSANACHQAGLTFSAVHDSFWTHAADIDQMNLILRDAFVRMHSDDVVGRLAAEFKVRHGKNLFLARVNRTSPIGKVIAKHRASTRLSKLQELIMENKRQTLLNSTDPEDQAEGRGMVTCASIFEQMDGKDEDLTIYKTMGQNSIGHIPSYATDDISTMSAPLGDADSIDSADPAVESLVGDLNMFDDKSVPDYECSVDDGEQVEGSEQKPQKKKGKREYTTWLWMPLNFRPIPKKGDWDVTRIRQSEYFFS